MTGVDERQIVRHVLEGRTAEFGLLVDRYGHMAFAVAARIVGTQQDAEELTQDVFLTAYRRLGSYDDRFPFATWLCRIAHNAAVSFMRRTKRDRCVAHVSEEELAAVTDDMATASLSGDSDTRRDLLRRAVAMLSADDRSLVTMFYYEGCSLREMAYILDMPDDERSSRTLATRICRIRKRLYVIIRKLENSDL